jgi:AcrR family transcriptional regulator
MRKQPTQARSRQRVTRIMQAAAQEFVEVGFDAATTNSIASRADTAIGSMYQFFGSKDEILDALADLYLTDLAALQATITVEEDVDVTLEGFLDPTIDRLIAYSKANPAFLTLFSSTSSNYLGVAAERIRAVVRAATLSALAHKELPEQSAETVATVCTEILRVLLPVAVTAGDRSDEMRAHLRAALIGYLTTIEAAMAAH